MFDNGKGHITVNDLKSILHSAFMMSPEESEALFNKIDTKGDGLITYGNRNDLVFFNKSSLSKCLKTLATF